MKKVAESIDGYAYGAAEIAVSPVSMQELENLKVSVGFTVEDQRYLELAGEVLADQTRQIVHHWRSGIIAGIPNLARHSRTPEGDPLPDYLAKSNLRFEQWILDTCLHRTIRTGSTTSRKLLCATRASRKTRSTVLSRRPTCLCATSSRLSR